MKIDCYVTLGKERDTVYKTEDIVRDLDRAGVDKAVIAPSDREIAVFNRQGNNVMLAEAGKFSDRLIPACTANPWYGIEAVDLFAESVKYLCMSIQVPIFTDRRGNLSIVPCVFLM